MGTRLETKLFKKLMSLLFFSFFNWIEKTFITRMCVDAVKLFSYKHLLHPQIHLLNLFGVIVGSVF